jgi:ABC-type branched-subunit amino acid transport system ATPase component
MPNVDPLADFQRQRHVLLDQQDRHADAMRDGVGKSTTLKTILGLVQASDGKVLLNGDDKS